ncbi:MAG: hypothetical protein M1830_003026 [Pleopsidium flavum]|nr:MAG: hypothetical protein M1830_003026 [Pleopsidium flavum]
MDGAALDATGCATTDAPEEAAGEESAVYRSKALVAPAGEAFESLLEPDPEPESELEPGLEPDTWLEPEPGLEPGLEPDTGLDSEPELGAEPEPELGTELEAAPESEGEAEADWSVMYLVEVKVDLRVVVGPPVPTASATGDELEVA